MCARPTFTELCSAIPKRQPSQAELLCKAGGLPDRWANTQLCSEKHVAPHRKVHPSRGSTSGAQIPRFEPRPFEMPKFPKQGPQTRSQSDKTLTHRDSEKFSSVAQRRL